MKILNDEQLAYLKSLESPKKRRKFMLDCLITVIAIAVTCNSVNAYQQSLRMLKSRVPFGWTLYCNADIKG